MARVLKESHSFTRTPRIHPLMEWTIPAFAFPAEAGTHLPTRRDGRLSWLWVAGWLHTERSVWHRELNPDTVTHLSTRRARRRLTSLIETNALSTTPDHQPESAGLRQGDLIRRVQIRSPDTEYRSWPDLPSADLRHRESGLNLELFLQLNPDPNPTVN